MSYAHDMRGHGDFGATPSRTPLPGTGRGETFSGAHPAALLAGDSVVEIRNLTVRAHGVELVQSVSLNVTAGETLCLVGESGCGKSLTCMSALGLIDRPLESQGSVRLFGQEVIGRTDGELNRLRGRDVAMIFQNPMAALNPVQRVGAQIQETLHLHTDVRGQAARARVIELLNQVGIPHPERHLTFYPHQLSGGMCQRVMIAMALACEPRLLVADEPTTALDVTIQAQILKLLKDLQRRTGIALIFVTHDLGVVAEIADRVAVMYSGRIVEEATVEELFARPQHPYTRALMQCRIGQNCKPGTYLDVIQGTVPAPAMRPQGCAFRPRCSLADADCMRRPELALSHDSRSRVACHRAQGSSRLA